MDDLLQRLEKDPGGLPGLIATLLPERRRLALIVDRLEELFTLAEPKKKDKDREKEKDREEQEKGRFLAAILALAKDPQGQAWAIATMRADFYGRLGRYPALAGEVVDHQLYVKDMVQAAVADVIEAPAAQVGAIFEKGLADQVREHASQRGQVVLPLLQHALDLLWRKRRGRWLTWDAYKEIGGVQGALRYQADRVAESLGADAKVARRLLTRLVRIEEGDAATVAGQRVVTATLTGGDPRRERVLQRLADERLVVLRGEKDQATAELIHDTLALHWELLRGWVREDRELLLWRQRLRADLDEWQRTKEDEGALLRGASLAEAERWLAERREDLGGDELDFIAASAALQKRERTARERRLRWSVSILIVGLAAAVALASIALLQWRRAEHQRDLALSGRLAAQGSAKLSGQLDLALLLGVEAELAADTFEARDLLLAGLERSRQIVSFFRARAGIRALAVDTTGRFLAAAFEDGTILRWDLLERRPIGPPLRSSGGWLSVLAFGPGGKTLVRVTHSTEAFQTIHLWDLSAARPIHRQVALGRQQPSMKVSFSPRNTMMALGGERSLLVWDLAALTPRGDPVPLATADLRFFELVSETTLAMFRDGEGWTVWDVAGKRPVQRRLPGLPRSPGLAASDGRHLAIAAKGGPILRWDLATGRQLYPFPTGPSPVQVLVYQGDDELVSVDLSGTILLWGLVTNGIPPWEPESISCGKLRLKLPSLDDPRAEPLRPFLFRISPTGRSLVAVDDSGVLKLTGLCKDDLREPIEIPGSVFETASAFTPDGGLVSARTTDAAITRWTLERRYSVGRLLPVSPNSENIAWSPDGRLLAWGESDGTVSLWDAGSERPADRLAGGHHRAVVAVAFSRDGKTLASSDAWGPPFLWDVATRKGRPVPTPIARNDDRGFFQSLAFTADGGSLVGWSLMGESMTSAVLVLDLGSGKVDPFFESTYPFMTAPAIHPRLPLVAVAEGPGIGLLDLNTRKQTMLPESASSVAFAPDGATLAAGRPDGSVVLWDLAALRRVGLPLAGQPGPSAMNRGVSSLDFDASGNFLVVHQSHGLVTVWDPVRGRRVLPPLTGEDSSMPFAKLNPTKPLLLTSGNQGTILWDLDVRAWVRRACEIANRKLTPEEWRELMGEDVPPGETCPGLPGPEEPAAR